MSALPDELPVQLQTFCRARTGDPAATVENVEVMPGHAGFSYGFTLRHDAVAGEPPRSYVLRLPPPGVRYEGPADMMHQVRALQAVHARGVPVPALRWWGEDPAWFGRPYYIVERLPGRTLWTRAGDWGEHLPAGTLRDMALQAIDALARLHAIDWQTAVLEWGPPLEPAEDVARWDRFWERAAEPELVKLGPELRRRLLDSLPDSPAIGMFHGDFQGTNHLYDGDRLVAVLDWELASVGAVLNDLGWYILFNDKESWTEESRPAAPVPSADAIEAMYADATGAAPRDVRWFRALAGYKFAIIGGFNLMLHRRGRRVDLHWEEMKPSFPRLMERALDVLSGG